MNIKDFLQLKDIEKIKMCIDGIIKALNDNVKIDTLMLSNFILVIKKSEIIMLNDEYRKKLLRICNVLKTLYNKEIDSIINHINTQNFEDMTKEELISYIKNNK